MRDVKKTLALAIVVSAACFVFVAVLYRNHQRFTPATDTVRMALDTHTGMLCLEDGAANAHGAASDWDTDRRLQTPVALSRLVRPTSISFRYAARIQSNDNGTVRCAYPAWLTGVDPDSRLAPEKNYRDWLIEGEMKQLKALLNSTPLLSVPVRISRALWYHEYAARTYYGEIRWVMVCVALESMLHTSRGYSTRQFAERLSLMASSLGLSITAQEAETAYDMRSRLSHGGATGKLSTSEGQLYLKLEMVLRAALKEAILNSSLRYLPMNTRFFQNGRLWSVR